MVLEGLGHVFLMQCTGTVLHAGAIMGPAGACVFYGAPHCGKTTLAHTAWRSGHPVVGDDRVLLSGDHDTVEPFPKCLKLRVSDDARPDPSLPDDMQALGALGDDCRLILARALEGFMPLGKRTPIAVLAHLERGGRTEITPLAPAEALASAVENIASGDDYDAMALVRLIKRQASQQRLFRLTVAPGESEAALAALTGASGPNRTGER